MLGDCFEDLVEDGGDDLSGPAGPGVARLGGQHLSGGIKDGGADLGSTEVDDDVDASGLGSARAAMSLGS